MYSGKCYMCKYTEKGKEDLPMRQAWKLRLGGWVVKEIFPSLHFHVFCIKKKQTIKNNK